MVDYIKMDLSLLDRQAIISTPGLQFSAMTNLTTGDIRYPEIADFMGMKILAYEKKLFVEGSLHKFYNRLRGSSAQNSDDFSFYGCRAAIKLLCTKLSIDPRLARINVLEFGVNIETEDSPSNIVDNHVYSYDFTFQHSSLNSYREGGILKDFKRAQFRVKLYDKGKHLGLERNVLRIEVVATKSRYLHRYEIHRLQDLMHQSSFRSLQDDFLKRFDQLIVLDQFDERAVPGYWRNLSKSKSPSTVSRRKEAFMAELEAADRLELRKSLRASCVAKWDDLISR